MGHGRGDDMKYMFNGATAFSGDLSGWNVLAVINPTVARTSATRLARAQTSTLLHSIMRLCGEPRMLKTVTVILVHAETESLLDTLIPVTDNTQPPTRCIVFVHNQDSRQLGPRSRHPRSLSQSSRAVHPVCASP